MEPLEFSLVSTQELRIRPPAYACFERLTGIIVFTGIFKLIRPTGAFKLIRPTFRPTGVFILIRPTFRPTGAFKLIRPTFRPTGAFILVFISILIFRLRDPIIALIGGY